MTECSYFAQLFFCGFQMLLHFFELSEALFDILIKLLLNLIRDGQQLCVHAIAD